MTRPKWLLCWSSALLGLTAVQARANNFTVTVVPSAQDLPATGGSVVTVEVFVTNTSGAPQDFIAYQLNWPCAAPPQMGASGVVGSKRCTFGRCSMSTGLACNNTPSPDCPSGETCTNLFCTDDADCVQGETCSVLEPLGGVSPWVNVFINPSGSENGAPSLMGVGPIYAVNYVICQVAATAFPVGTIYTLPVGAVRYLATIEYTVSNCASGDFTLKLEGFTDPKNPSPLNATRFRAPRAVPTLHPWTYGGNVTLTIPTGRCCDGSTCLGDLNEQCCVEAGGTWTPVLRCADGCPCLEEADCDDGDACTSDSCDNGRCRHGDPPDCDDSNVCTLDRCNPQTGRCTFTERCFYADLDTEDGQCTVTREDVECVLGDFAGSNPCPGSDLFPCNPDGVVNFNDVLAAIEALENNPPCPDPTNCG